MSKKEDKEIVDKMLENMRPKPSPEEAGEQAAARICNIKTIPRVRSAAHPFPSDDTTTH